MAYERINFKTGQVLTADALNHMEDGIAMAMEGGGVTATTYAELKALRDAGQLKAGAFYRITDYMTTTTQENTQSAGHQFDVIVLALDGSRLSEKAWAAHHEGDEYFKDSNLSAWQIWYCLDNDEARFAWADAENGKGVIYRMIDEFDNDVPYDFKNIMFVRYKVASPELVSEYNYLEQLSDGIISAFSDNALSFLFCMTSSNTKYWEERFQMIESPATGESKAFFTFSRVVDGALTDDSLTQSKGNRIGEYRTDVKILNNNIFFYTNAKGGIEYNVLGYNCHSNTFGAKCNKITFGNNCYENVLGEDCSAVIFGNDCRGNVICQNSEKNIVGDAFQYNTLGSGCLNNMFGNNCESNILANECTANNFANNCRNNALCNGCEMNIFEVNCDGNTLGDYCIYNNLLSTTDGEIEEYSERKHIGYNSTLETVIKNFFD